MALQQDPPGQSCGHCAHFRNDPAFLEVAFGGLNALSSARGSVRGNDGVCVVHGRYLTAGASCPKFEPCPHPLPP
jgi:hypothetical protein